MIFYKHFIGDYQRDTGHLSILEHGAYRLLMDACYATEKPLPADERRIFRLLRATEPAEHDAIRTVLAEFWELGTDGWTNKRAVEEIAAQNERSEKARRSARIRHGKDKRSAPAPANACAIASEAQESAACARSASHSQTPEPEEKGDPPPYPPPSNGHKHLTAFMDRYTAPTAECAAAVAAYNELAAECDLPVVGAVLGQAREDNLRRRLVECGGLEGWKAALEKVRDSPMLRGQNDDGWKADLTFLVKQQNFIRLMEGGYDRSGHGPARKLTQREITDNGLSAFREALDE